MKKSKKKSPPWKFYAAPSRPPQRQEDLFRVDCLVCSVHALLSVDVSVVRSKILHPLISTHIYSEVVFL